MVITLQMKTFRGMMMVYDICGMVSLDYKFGDPDNSVDIDVHKDTSRTNLRKAMAFASEYVEAEVDDE